MPWTFEGIEGQPKTQSSVASPQGGFTFEAVEPIEQPSIGLAGQAAAGGASFFTWPADVYKAMVRAQGLDLLNEMGEDNPEAREAVERLSNKIPTQQGLEDYLEKKTGYRFSPQTGWEKTFRAGGELFSPGGMLKGGVKQAAKTISKRATAAGTGAVAQESLKDLGIHPAIAGLVGVGASSLADITHKFSQEGKAIKDLAQKHKLREAQYMVKGKPTVPQLITKSRGGKILEEVGSTSKEAIDKILHEINPVGKLKKQGIDIEAYTNNVLEKTRKAAQKSKYNIDLNPVIKSIDRKIAEIKSQAPSLSDVDKKYIELLEEKGGDFSENPVISSEQHLNQYRKNNDDRTAFYKNPQMTHLQEAANNAYGFLNNELIKAAEDTAKATGSQEYIDFLKAGNILHKQKSDLMQASSILQPFFEEPNISNLNKVLKNKRNQKFLQRTLGPNSFAEINKIGKYAKKAQDKLKESFIQHGENWLNVTRDLGLVSVLALSHPTITKLLDLGVTGMFVKGAVMANKTMRGDLLSLEKAMISGSEKAIRKASSKLNSDFEQEHGDIQDLISDQA